MSARPDSSPAATVEREALKWAWPLVLILAAALSYANCFSVPFQFDDEFAISGNASIRHLLSSFSPPVGTTVGGRPVLNLLFALNYAAGGLSVTGYHVINLIIHCLCALLLFGIARRTLEQVSGAAGYGRRVGFVTALLWTVHPLQTESVTYLSQRAESAAGLFYLAVLYFFLRSACSARPAWWSLAAVAACALGMATKETMVSAPVVILVYDVLFLSGSFSRALRTRGAFYLALLATWVVLALLVTSTGGNRGGSSGFGSGIGWVDYVATQFPALVHYLRLVVWPWPLVFEYGPIRVDGFSSILPEILFVAVLACATLWGFQRRKHWSFLGVWFFACLAPTSLVPGAIQMMAEHRMYLASAAVICGLAIGADALLAHFRRWPKEAALWGVAGVLALGLGLATYDRNRVYRSALALWEDTTLKRPEHALAHYNFANELAKDPGSIPRAISEYERAIALRPHLPIAHYNLAVVLERLPGRMDEAVTQYELAVSDHPDYLEAQNNLGTALVRTGRAREALPHLEKAHALAPQALAIARNLGTACLLCGEYERAVSAYTDALRIDPRDLIAHKYIATSLLQLGRAEEAQRHAEEARRIEQGG